ncbi:MAG: hypothetical protein GXP09_12860 [Gammaproteobacteria bacterium]|nr:hypothetical protein [Gammaproteobacteria bacterium]
MGSEQMSRRYSRNILIRMVVLGTFAAGLIVWQLDFLRALYFHNQLATVGWLINGTILAMFATGLGRIVIILRRYMGEELALAEFLANLRRGVGDPGDSIDPESIIAQRFSDLKDARRHGGMVDHHALAATLVATLSTETSLPKFVNNMLILTGVFGTIVSLSIALIGASDILAATGTSNGIGTVIQGMSTALSTTMTAIACYFFYGYFYMKLTDSQTRLLSAIEHVTATRLVPQLQPSPDTLVSQFAGLMRSTEALVNRMQSNSEQFDGVAKEMHGSLQQFRQELGGLSSGMAAIIKLLQEGFRLPPGTKGDKQ